MGSDAIMWLNASNGHRRDVVATAASAKECAYPIVQLPKNYRRPSVRASFWTI